MSAYYNEIDPYAAQWLRNLIAAGHIAAGDVDERSIVDVRADDLRGYTQCHFFAGIGGWSLALRMAGWDDARPVWTGSCPCQPFSSAGARLGEADERHLWPVFCRLIAECRPSIAFGEQVASSDGRRWLAAVRADLEALGYAVGAADLCAASVGALHNRARLYWAASNADSDGEHAGAVNAEASTSPEPSDTVRAGLQIPGPLKAGAHGVKSWGMSPADHWWSAESGLVPVVHGVRCRMAQVRAVGNAIVPQVAAAFVRATL